MKTFRLNRVIAGLTAAILSAVAQPTSDSLKPRETTAAAAARNYSARPAAPAITVEKPNGPAAQPTANGSVAQSPLASDAANGKAPGIQSGYVLLPNGEKGLRLNFRGAPLDLALFAPFDWQFLRKNKVAR